MKKNTLSKIKPIPIQETIIGDLIRPFNDSCNCLYKRVKDRFFDDKEQGKYNVKTIEICSYCMKSMVALGLDIKNMTDCYISSNTLVLYYEKKHSN